MARKISKRAEILKRLLPLIDAGNFAEWDRFIVFGASSVGEVMEELTGSPNDLDDSLLGDALAKFISDFKLHLGREQVTERMSLGQPPRFKTNALDGLSREERLHLRTVVEDALPELRSETDLPWGSSGRTDEDALDAAFTAEMLGKIPKAVDRAAHHDKMSLDLVPDESVKYYFEEAHRCYLLGFNVACAVLCRAILASALEEICKRRDVKFEILVDRAIACGHLQDVPKEWAIDVRNAGNEAIHNLPEFKRLWECKLDEILMKTRRALLDLYGHSTSGRRP